MSGPNVLCLYRDDLDGRCSAAIAKQVHPEAILYNMANSDGPILPWDLVGEAELVILVGSLGRTDMMLLTDCPVVVVWFDHDRVAIDELGSFDLVVEGVRDVEKATCELIWDYYNPDAPIPDVVRYVADQELGMWGLAHTQDYCEALVFERVSPIHPLWDRLLTDNWLSEKLITRGTAMLQAKRRHIQADVEQRGYPAALAWAKHGLAINSPGNNELGKYILSRGYTIAICYAHRVLNGDLVTQVWLYSDHADVDKIAREYGADQYDGGHSRAAQFHLPADEALPWTLVRHEVE